MLDQCNNWKNRTFLQSPTYALRFIFLYYVIVTILHGYASAQPECDYNGSGLDVTNRKEVQSVYLACTGGEVRWKFPRGALRITMRSPDGRNFRACIKSSNESSGARIFLEGHRTLIRVYRNDGPAKDSVRCFTSYHSRISFYVEESPTKKFQKLTTSFQYHLQSISGEMYDPFDECKPCSSGEMMRAYCSADFAAKGIFVGYEDAGERRIFTFAAARVLQQGTPIFRSSPHPRLSDRTGTGFSASRAAADKENKVVGNVMAMAASSYVGSFGVPIRCEASIGPGEYVVMGRIRLGEPLLKCAASIEQWRRLVRSEQANAPCALDQ